MRSSDGSMRDLVTSMPGAGWDYAQTRHPYHFVERPKGPHYCVYNRRHMACCFDDHSTDSALAVSCSLQSELVLVVMLA